MSGHISPQAEELYTLLYSGSHLYMVRRGFELLACFSPMLCRVPAHEELLALGGIARVHRDSYQGVILVL